MREELVIRARRVLVYVWTNSVMGYAIVSSLVAQHGASYTSKSAQVGWTIVHFICVLSFIGVIAWVNMRLTRNRYLLAASQTVSFLWVLYCFSLGALFTGGGI